MKDQEDNCDLFKERLDFIAQRIELLCREVETTLDDSELKPFYFGQLLYYMHAHMDVKPVPWRLVQMFSPVWHKYNHLASAGAMRLPMKQSGLFLFSLV